METNMVNMNEGLSLESYLVGYLHRALNNISDCLSVNDSNKAMRITHEVLKYIKDQLNPNEKPTETNEVNNNEASL